MTPTVTQHPSPSFSLDQARQSLRSIYGVDASLHPLPSERDQNFRATAADGAQYIFKIINVAESPQSIDFQTAMLRHLLESDASLPVPRLVPSLDGSDLAHVQGPEGQSHAVRLVAYIPGMPLAEAKVDAATLRDLGRVLGHVDKALMSFGHAGAFHSFDWEIRRTPQARTRLHHVSDAGRHALLSRVLDRYDRVVAPRLKQLRCGVIHNDANDWNVIVESASGGRVTGLIDFGDAAYSPLVAELAVACAYAMFDKPSAIQAAAEIVAGYHAVLPLQDIEFELLPALIASRLAISVSFSSARKEQALANPYLLISERQAWAMLEQLDRMDPFIATGILRKACGLEAWPGASAVRHWLDRHAHQLAGVLQPHPARQEKRVLPLTDAQDPLCKANIDGDVGAMLASYAQAQAVHGFTLGLGPWGEQRAVYAAGFFESALIAGQRRSQHLGLDLFAPAGTALHTPLAARVAGLAICPEAQGYGGVVLLEHEPEPGLRFASLWGHLSHDSVRRLRVGQSLPAGALLAQMGEVSENGGWTPHVHVQLALPPYADVTAIPGVGEPEFQAVWADLFPRPDAFAGVPAEAFASSGRSKPELLAARRALLAPNLSLSYKVPLKIVRGQDVWLIDAGGRAYLDCYNNVCHVGHCHPGVVQAIQGQVARLNTNTRYLHDNIVNYAERLARTLPPELDTFFFLNSGSEANELALRMARHHTGRQDMLVLDWAYHGNTPNLIAISPYKYKRKGGAGRPPHTHELPLPESYRLPADWPQDMRAEQIGARYGAEAAARIEMLAGSGHAPAAFIAETIPSVAGQVFLPPGYLRQVYAAVRQAGGLCIADEVQVGFGRVGSHWWAFEEHGVRPDMVVMGKPAGNGHPLGVLVTRREIAERFANGMEYFNTFGGNPVSCAAGLAVLDALEGQQLLANAQAQGEFLMGGLRQLMQRHAQIGDVRGRGLFLGIDMVSDRQSKAHATATAGAIANRMRELGVLAGTDGPFDNVIKLRPPMTLQREHAELLLGVMGQAMDELL